MFGASRDEFAIQKLSAIGRNIFRIIGLLKAENCVLRYLQLPIIGVRLEMTGNL